MAQKKDQRLILLKPCTIRPLHKQTYQNLAWYYPLVLPINDQIQISYSNSTKRLPHWNNILMKPCSGVVEIEGCMGMACPHKNLRGSVVPAEYLLRYLFLLPMLFNVPCSMLHSSEDCGVPQGSVLGARMYLMYTRQLAHITQRHGLHHHSYADDIQIYTHCMDNEEARSEAAAKIENYISEICTWMKTNALKINEEKTECIIFSKNTEEAHMTLLAGTQIVKSQETAKILRVTLDTKMSFDQQIFSISRLVHMYMKKIKRIRMYSSDFALKTLIQSTVTVRLDYYNSQYNGLTQKSTRKLQLAQNAAARLIAKISICDPITNVLRELLCLQKVTGPPNINTG